jgi:hypothetical protein
MLGRSRFAKTVETQLDMFVRDHHDVLEEVEERLAAYNSADRSEAEELYGDYDDAVEAGADVLADMRDHFASTLEEPEDYVRAFNRAVARRLPAFAAAVESR